MIKVRMPEMTVTRAELKEEEFEQMFNFPE